MTDELPFTNNKNKNNTFFDDHHHHHSDILLGSTHFVEIAEHVNNNNNNGLYETNNAGDAIPRPRKLRRVSTTGEDYSRIRSTDDIIRLRKTHRRSPCLLVGGWQGGCHYPDNMPPPNQVRALEQHEQQQQQQ